MSMGTDYIQLCLWKSTTKATGAFLLTGAVGIPTNVKDPFDAGRNSDGIDWRGAVHGRLIRRFVADQRTSGLNNLLLSNRSASRAL